MALDLPLPKHIFAHGWITIDESKMSKSLGNVISPTSVLESFNLEHPDAFRYYMASSAPCGRDGNYSDDDFKEKVNAHLANSMGNLLNRTLSMLVKYFDGEVKAEFKGENPLDNTDVHPESYQVAEKIIQAAGINVDELGTPSADDKLKKIDVKQFTDDQVGTETVTDIISSLQKPGRDLRDSMPAPLLRHDVMTIEDLKPGMKLQGTVRNVVDFGAFVDIGVKHDGLVHVSKMSKQFIRDPRAMVAVGDIVDVWIDDVDLKRQRIQLTMLEPETVTND